MASLLPSIHLFQSRALPLKWPNAKPIKETSFSSPTLYTLNPLNFSKWVSDLQSKSLNYIFSGALALLSLTGVLEVEWKKELHHAEAPQRVNAFVQRVTTFVSNLWDDQNEKREEVTNIRNQSDVNVPNNQDVVINVTQTDAGVSAATSLLHQAPLNAQATGGSDIENPRSLSPTDQDVVINVSGAVRDQTDVGVSHTTVPIGAQAISSFNIESSRSSTQFEVVSNDNVAHEVRDQTVVDMSDTASLLPQIPIAAQATGSSHIQNSRNLPREGGQNSSGIANVGSGVPSHSGRPLRPNEGCGIDIQALITEAKEVANRVTIISAGGIFSVLSGVIGNEEADLMHEYFFKAFMILCYVSLALGLGLHRLIKISPETRGFAMMVKFTIYFSQGSLIYAVSCAICILFPSKVGVVVILIVPLVPIGLVAILSYARKDQRPSV